MSSYLFRIFSLKITQLQLDEIIEIIILGKQEIINPDSKFFTVLRSVISRHYLIHIESHCIRTRKFSNTIRHQ